jgi:hypothetical protein
MQMRTAKLLVAAVALVLLMKCSQSLFTAPPGSSITLFTNPSHIPTNGGVSVVTAIVIDGTGQPVPDGTVVQFFTDLGRIDPQGRTNDGVAKVNLVSDGRSGTAKCSAISGGGDLPIPTPTSTGTGTPTPTPSASATASTPATTAPSGSDGPCTVRIGAGTVSGVVAIADPRNIARDAPRFTTLVATVLDDQGNPVANVPIVFTLPTTNLNTFEESFESRGLPVFTDNNGQARDRLFTSRPRDASPKPITVIATAVNTVGTSDSVNVGVNF